MRVVFWGTPDFAVASLEALLEANQEVVLVVTQPDKPKGRGYVLTPSPVKSYALEHGIECISPASLYDKEVIDKLRSTDADLFVVTAFGRILKKEILDMPKLGCVNVHASLLPEWRGAAPINRALMNGDRVGGVTVMFMDIGMDTGDIILKKSMEIPDDMAAGEFHDALAAIGKDVLKEFIALAEHGEIPREKQDDTMATYAAKIGNDDAYITFSESAVKTKDRIRGLSPFPGAFFFLGGKRIKVREATVSDGCGEVGSVLSTDKGGIEIACAEGSVIITKLCPEGKGVCDAESYLRGHRIENGTKVNG